MFDKISEGIRAEHVLCGIRPNAFDLCIVDTRVLFVKIKPNADKITPEQARELKAVSRLADAEPIMLSSKSGSRALCDGVVYTRRNVPVLTLETLQDYIDQKPLAYADRGGAKLILDPDNLRMVRGELGLSRQHVGDFVGVSAEMIRKYEAGESQPSITASQRLIDLFGDRVLSKHRVEYASLPETWISRFFKGMGFDVETPLKAPFDVIARSEHLLFGVCEGRKMEERIKLMERLSDLLDARYFILSEKESGTNTIQKDELVQLSKEELLERTNR